MRFHSPLKIAFTLLVLIAAIPSVYADYKDDIGYTRLVQELGVSTPTGAGVAVTQIEAPESGNYRPNTAAFPGVSFSFPGGGSTGSSSHATTVGGYFYGSGSTSPGITNVTGYDVNYWISSIMATNPPTAVSGKVQNNSWIGTLGSTNSDTSILLRYDYAINRDDIVAVVGLNNGNQGTVPPLLASGYNSIAVGLSDGNSSYGLTNTNLGSLYGVARQKPTIVAPAGTTSWATAMVSSAAAMLVSSASTSSAARNEVIRATMMAGASKSKFGNNWTHTDTAPLDTEYGAGELNVYNNYHIQAAGEQNGNTSPSTSVTSTGWDLGNTGSANPIYYYFDVAETSDFTAALTWNIIVTPNISWSSVSLTLADLDLYLYTATGFAVGSLVAQSISDTENVELLWLKNLSAGRYALRVNSDLINTEYALAWQSIPEPSTWVLIVIGFVSVCFSARRHQFAFSKN